MGANFETACFDVSSNDVLKKNFEDYQKELCMSNGESKYKGHLGIVRGLSVSSKVFKDESSANDWLQKSVKKWQPAIAVKVGDFNSVFPQTKADKKLVEQYSDLNNEIQNWSKSILERVKAGKSEFRGCAYCGSKIAVKYMKNTSCPVCHSSNFLNTETDEKKYAALTKKFKEVSTKLTQAKANFKKPKNPAFWLIGGLCAS